MNYLFRSHSLFEIQEGAQRKLKKAVERLTATEVRDPLTIDRLVQEHSFDIPIIDEGGIAVVSQKDVQVDARNYPDRIVFDRGRPVWIPGTEVIIGVPFIGEPGWFTVQPSTFNGNPPWGDIVGSEIHLVYRRPDYNVEAIKADYTRNVAEIQQHLEWLRQSAAPFNTRMATLVRQLVEQRTEHLSRSSEMATGLGLPVRRQPQPPTATPSLPAPATKHTTAPRQTKNWDVFISHASEDKEDIARPLYNALKKAGLEVWFDEATLRLGDSLRAKIDEGLSRSRFGVVILSKQFFEKHWPQQELNGLATREINGHKVILPIWHNMEHDDIAAFSPTLADRLAAKSSKGLDALVAEIMSVVRNG